MPEMHLKQPVFTYSACGPFTKNKERIEKNMQTGNTDFIYTNELDKACFQHDMACGKSKDLAKRRKPNKIWLDKCGEFYNNLFKRFLKINKIEMCSAYNERKSVVAERFSRELFKHMTAVSKNVYFDISNDIVYIYNNAVHRTMKMKPIDVTSDSYAECNEDFNEKDPKFKVCGRVRISKYKIIFAKAYTQNWSEVFVVSKIKNTIPWTYVISDLNGEPITEKFYEEESQKKLIKRN